MFLSQNNNIWFLRKYPDYFITSICNYYPLKIEQIDHYKDYLDWYWLSCRYDLPWSLDFMKKFEKYLDWGEGDKDIVPRWINTNEGIPWSIEIIETFFDKWQWESLSQNNKIVTNGKILYKYLNKLDPDLVAIQRKKLFNNSDRESFLYIPKSGIELAESIFLNMHDIAPVELATFGNSFNDLLLIDKYADKVDWQRLMGFKDEFWDKYFSLNDYTLDVIFSEIITHSI